MSNPSSASARCPVSEALFVVRWRQRQKWDILFLSACSARSFSQIEILNGGPCAFRPTTPQPCHAEIAKAPFHLARQFPGTWNVLYGDRTKPDGKKQGGVWECPAEKDRAADLGPGKHSSDIADPALAAGVDRVITERYKRLIAVLCSPEVALWPPFL